MKRMLYIGAFTFLGLLVATLIHAGIEFPLLSMMQDDLALTGTSVLLDHWPLIHGVGGKLLWLLGAFAGFVAGKKFWRILYVEKRYGTPRW